MLVINLLRTTKDEGNYELLLAKRGKRAGATHLEGDRTCLLHLKHSSEERDAQQAAAAMLKQMMRDAALPVMDSTTHIVPLMVGDPVKAKRISDILLAEYGVYVQPINFPTVPRGTERLRFTPGPAHTEEMMRELVEALAEIWDRLELELRQAA